MRHLLRGLIGALLLLGWSGAAPAQAPLTVGLRPVAPYVIEFPDGRLGGLEYDLLNAAMHAATLDFRAALAPFARLAEAFRRRELDAATPANASMDLSGCLSDTLLVYRNTAFLLAARNLPLASIADLDGHDVMAFQNAHRILGPSMTAVQARNPRYREVANQMLQIRALFSGRADAVILDRRIFHYLRRHPDADIDTSAAIAEHALFPPTDYAVAFHDAALCARFNGGLAAIRRSGLYDQILRHWEPGGPQALNGAAKPPG